METRLIRVSKSLSKHLRHAPQEPGLTLRPGGWVPVDDLLAAAEEHGFPLRSDELVECVETDDKQRFSFDETGDLIRANQGHRVEVDLPLLLSANGVRLTDSVPPRYLEVMTTIVLAPERRSS